jgi:hypothetical protein
MAKMHLDRANGGSGGGGSGGTGNTGSVSSAGGAAFDALEFTFIGKSSVGCFGGSPSGDGRPCRLTRGVT